MFDEDLKCVVSARWYSSRVMCGHYLQSNALVGPSLAPNVVDSEVE